MAPFRGKQRPFLGIIFGITEVFGPEGSFAAFAGFHIVTNRLIWLKKKRNAKSCQPLASHILHQMLQYFQVQQNMIESKMIPVPVHYTVHQK